MRHVIHIFELATLAAATPLIIRQSDSTTNSSMNNLASIPITKDVQWAPCFGNFTCLNLEVPLDYDHPESGSTNIAFTRYEALKQPALGNIIVNPGGPGSSGVNFILQPERLLRLLGHRYNLIGMDPRGVNNSGPNRNPLIDTPATRNEYAIDDAWEFDPRSPAAVKRTFAQASAYGVFASQKLSDRVNYVSTPATARNMLHYVELVADSRGEAKASAKLNFYGVSYCSILGTTFAQLFPDCVGRMIIDGVMDPNDYYGGAWVKSIIQGDDAVSGFALQCFEAGEKCAFFANDTSANAILQRLDAILDDLEQDPIEISNPYHVDFPTVVTHMDLRNAIFSAVYRSCAEFPGLATTLAHLEQRNGMGSAVASGKGVVLPAECNGQIPAYNLVLSKYPTVCNDVDGRYDISSSKRFQDYVTELEGTSKYIGAVWSRQMILYCHKLRFSPLESQKILSTLACY